MTEHTTIQIGDTELQEKKGTVVVFDCATEREEIGHITAAGLQDAARLDDEILSKIGSLAYGAEKYMENND